MKIRSWISSSSSINTAADRPVPPPKGVFSNDASNSLNPRNAHVTFLAMHNNLLYAASSNKINIFELINFTLIDTFNNKDPSSGSAKSVIFLDGKIFAAHQDCKIRVWKLSPNKQHKLIATLSGLAMNKNLMCSVL
uniref:Uncharacterized protein n=1 Tax=Solanum lycopersicum TaxID=4081 RepID=A0A3Q7I2G9_SOLLC